MGKMSNKYDWKKVYERLDAIGYSSWTEASAALDIPRKTLTEGIQRHTGIQTLPKPKLVTVTNEKASVVDGLIERINPISRRQYPHRVVGSREKTSIAFLLSDVHYGAKFEGDDLFPCYSSDVSSKYLVRYFEWMKEKIEEIGPEEVHIISLGDLVDGTHLRLQHARETDKNLVDQCMDVVDIFIDQLPRVVDLSKNISFWSVPGNHARVQQRVGSGHPAENMDLMISRFIQRYMAKQPISFNISTNWYVSGEISGNHAIAVHGDEVRGFSNPLRSIGERAIAYQNKMIQSGRFTRLDSVFCGHFHNQMSHDNGVVKTYMNGAFQTSSEYVSRELGKISRPTQTAILFNKEDGAYGQMTCFLDG
jgi:hypothetical protein